jgi:hypothetical protein
MIVPVQGLVVILPRLTDTYGPNTTLG